MASKKRYTRTEIAAKLAQAKELSAQGAPQSEIAETIGVSVMTLYRWRKASAESAASAAPDDLNQFKMELGQDQRLADLQRENSQLRRLVIDLLLEKMKIEEAAQSCGSSNEQRRRS
jgi:putative transposase